MCSQLFLNGLHPFCNSSNAECFDGAFENILCVWTEIGTVFCWGPSCPHVTEDRVGWQWELGSSPVLSHFKSLLLALSLQLFWVFRPAGDWVLPWETGQICVRVSVYQLIDLSAS